MDDLPKLVFKNPVEYLKLVLKRFRLAFLFLCVLAIGIHLINNTKAFTGEKEVLRFITTEKHNLTGQKEISLRQNMESKSTDPPITTTTGLISEDAHSKGNSTLVLLVTYFRSGSTFTADIVKQIPGIFHFYEPFKEANIQSTTQEHLDIMVGNLTNYYNCHIDQLPLRDILNPNNTKENPWMQSFFNCGENVQIHTCFHRVRDICLKAELRSVKTIRLTMNAAGVLMQKLPGLKVIHLLRDPRGILSSQKTSGLCKNTPIQELASRMCRKMANNILTARQLLKLYPGKIKTLLYEKIAESPKAGSESIFNFIEKKPHDLFDEWLYKHTMAGIESGFYKTFRPNSTQTSMKWRLNSSLERVQIIDKECQTLYRYMGLLPFDNKQTLRNTNIPSRIDTVEFRDFL